MPENPTSVRIDKWLWAARFFKTRSLAQDAVELGRVRVAGDRIKPSREVHLGDRFQIERAGENWDIEVTGLSVVRGAAPIAQTLYRETDASKERRLRVAQAKRTAIEPASTIEKGRPTKRDARMLRKFKESWS